MKFPSPHKLHQIVTSILGVILSFIPVDPDDVVSIHDEVKDVGHCRWAPSPPLFEEFLKTFRSKRESVGRSVVFHLPASLQHQGTQPPVLA